MNKPVKLIFTMAFFVISICLGMGESPTKYDKKFILDTEENRNKIYDIAKIKNFDLPTNGIVDITGNSKIIFHEYKQKDVYWREPTYYLVTLGMYNDVNHYSESVYVFKATYNKQLGYIVSKNPDISLINKIRTESRIKQVNEYLSKNPSSSKYRQAFIKGSIMKGMSKGDVRFSWGNPDRENTNSERYLEQWVYDSHYVYFTNGVLVSWQSNN